MELKRYGFIIRLLFSLTIAIILMSPYPYSADFNQGIVKLSDRLADGTQIQLELYTIKITSSYPYKNAVMWGGDWEGEDKVLMPKTVISDMHIKVGNEKMYIPLSAYSDLGNPYQISLGKLQSHNEFQIIILGGDAGGSYRAVLTFDREKILRRRVMLGENSCEVWEETVYSYVSDRGQ